MTYTREEIREKITTNPQWTERAIVALYKKQTDQEQINGQTIEHNGMGFNGLDAEILTSFALWIGKGRHLTPKQLQVAQKKLSKYATQLTLIANG